MRRLLYLAALSMLVVALTASVALGQSRGPSGADGSFNCEDFDTQEQAQEFFDADPSDPDGLDGPPGDAFTGEPGVACEGLPSGGGGDTGTPPAGGGNGDMTGDTGGGATLNGGNTADLDCIDFATQAEAQATYDADPSDPNGLDADGDGIACETNTDTANTTEFEDDTGVASGGPLIAEDDATGEQYADDDADDEDVAALPDTGGPALLLPVAALLLGLAGLSCAVLRRGRRQ